MSLLEFVSEEIIGLLVDGKRTLELEETDHPD